MRLEATGSRARADVSMAAGVAEHLPLREGCAGVVWMSAVWHHLTDRSAAAAEVGRVLAPDGVWLLRGFFSERSTVGWLDWFPGADRARARFPSAAATAELAAAHGFVVRAASEVESDAGASIRETTEWIRAMRSADTLLCALSDDEIAAGLEAMEGHPDERCEPNRLTLLALERSPEPGNVRPGR
jgi:SAM-dependent methyltransferase